MKNQISTAIILLVSFNWGISQNTSPNFSNEGRDWFISKNTGSGQMGTKERPAKDLGNIIHHLKPNDLQSDLQQVHEPIDLWTMDWKKQTVQSPKLHQHPG